MHKEDPMIDEATDIKAFIIQQLSLKETLSGYLSKAEALVEIAMAHDLLNQDETVLRNYLWTIRDLLTDAGELNEQQIAHWMQHCSSQNSPA